MKIELRKTTEPGWVQITTYDERFYLRQEDERVFPSVTWISGYYPKGVAFYKWLASKGWDESVALKEAAGERGKKVHRAIEQLLQTGKVKIGDTFPVGEGDDFAELTVEEYEAVMSFHAWYQETKPKVLAIETLCYNEEDDYAGTIDLKVEIEGKVWLVDLKTSQDIWPEHKLQVSAYRHTPQGTSDFGAILQVGYRKNKRLYKFTEVEDQYDLFLAAKRIWHAENDNVVPRQKDYPVELIIEIPTKEAEDATHERNVSVAVP